MTAEPLDLDAIQARVAAATPGPWMAWEDEGHLAVCSDDGQLDIVPIVYENLTAVDALTDVDADFIAHSREDIPALLAEVERLTGERDRARSLAVRYEQELAKVTTTRMGDHSHEWWDWSSWDAACAACELGTEAKR